jgi:putative membrane protein
MTTGHEGEPLPPPAWPPAPASDDRALLAHPTRQSPIALAFIAWRFVRRLGFSALLAAIVFVTRGGIGIGLGVLAVVAATVLLIFSSLSWWRFTFVAAGDELIVTKGILSVQRVVIPLDRVQSVAIEQRLVHRIVGLVRVAVDTAGSSQTEFEIDAVDRRHAEALRRLAADTRNDLQPVGAHHGAADSEVAEVVVRRSVRDLLLVGLTSAPWAGLVVFAPLLAFGDELGQLGGWIEGVSDRVGDVGDRSLGSLVLVVFGVILVVTVLGAVLQIAREILTNWDLTLVRTASGLRRTAGLLSTTSRSSTVRRIQSITTDDTPPQRWLGFSHARLRVFGDNDLSLPGVRPDELARLRALVFGAAAPPVLDRMISRWSVFRAVRNAAILTVVAAIALWFAVGSWAALSLLAVPVQWAIARHRWRRRRWGLADGRLAESYELLHRHTAEVPIVKAQFVTVSQSFFERRKGLATVRLQSADGHLAVPMIAVSDAFAVRDLVLHTVETDRRRVL